MVSNIVGVFGFATPSVPTLFLFVSFRADKSIELFEFRIY